MKYVIALLIGLYLVLPISVSAAPCQGIWDGVAEQTFVLEVEDQSFDVVFSGAYAGPCPQGIVEVYDGIYIAPVLICTYTSGDNDMVYLDCDGEELPFMLRGTTLEYYVPSPLTMERKDAE